VFKKRLITFLIHKENIKYLDLFQKVIIKLINNF